MICYRCDRASSCPTFRTLYSMSKDFNINDCRDYDEASQYKYKKIAEHDDLMHLIYDYFTHQVEKYIDEEIKQAITNALLNL